MFQIDFSAREPIYEQLFTDVIRLAAAGALKPGDKPEAVFALANGETVVAAYEYCNLHGLWKADC